MQVLASIPELPLTAVVPPRVEQAPALHERALHERAPREPAACEPPPREPAPAVDPVVESPGGVEAAAGDDEPLPVVRRDRVSRAGGGRPPRRFPAPSVIVLAAVAAAFWAVAWRNERLKLESQRARPERLARELPATADATRSIVP